MKLNFLNVLNKKSAPDEIAEQIVALEAKKAQCEKARDEAKNSCKEMRGKTMCGERVDSAAIKRADKAYEEAVLDLEIVADSLEELNKQLYIALEAHREEESKQIIEDSHKWAAEKEKLMPFSACPIKYCDSAEYAKTKKAMALIDNESFMWYILIVNES